MTSNFMIWQADVNVDQIDNDQREYIEFENDSFQSVDMDSAFLSMELQYESAQIMNEINDRIVTA
jgi:aminoglycoside phosphotransferase family enzyme